jgi:hypothetical protein
LSFVLQSAWNKDPALWRCGRCRWAWAACEPSVFPSHLDLFYLTINSTGHWLFHCPRSQGHLRSCDPQLTSEGYQTMWSWVAWRGPLCINGFVWFPHYIPSKPLSPLRLFRST